MTLLTTIAASQAQKEVTANENFIATGPAGLFGRKYSTTTSLTWGYYGGILLIDGVLTTISDGTVALTASTTNYVEATRAGVVSKNTTGFTAGQIPLYTVVTASASITSYTDQRLTNPRRTGRLSKSVAGSADVTLTDAEARNEILEFTGALTGNINVIVPSVADQWTVFNNTTGSFTLKVKTSAGTGVFVLQGRRTILLGDGTNVVPATSDPTQTTATNQDIAYAASITPDASLGERVIVGILTGNITTNAPTNPRKGGKLEFAFAQDATGARTMTWNTAFIKAADGAGTAGQKTAGAFVYDGAHWVQVGGAGIVWLSITPDSPPPRSNAALLAQTLSAWQPPPNLSQGKARGAWLL